MADCKNCPFYDEDYDFMKNKMNDVIVDEEEDAEHRFCIMHEKHIDRYFLHKQQCEYEIPKNHESHGKL